MTLANPRRVRLLRPRLATDAVARPRLVARLMEGLERPLTLIAAPAGYGKTTLLRQWLDACPARGAWLALDARDGDPAGFLTAVVGALQALWPDAQAGVGRDALGLLRLPAVPPPAYLGAALADALLDLPEPAVLVLDDYQAIADPAAHALVAALLEHPPPGFHLAIAGRVEPPLPLARLRARDQVTELRARDLAFTTDEAQAFLARAAGADVGPEAAAELERRTEGWAVGLRLAALALREAGEAGEAGAARVAAAFAGRRQRHAMDFLLDEVLAQQPAELQDFLLRTSVVERVCGPLCEALLEPAPPPGAGAATLRRLVEADLFATALEEDGDGPEWTQYHPLFRELLRERLAEREGAEAVAELHRRAAGWFAAHGLVDVAIEALLAGGEPDSAARLVEEQVAAVLDREDWPTLWRWLRRLPDETARWRPGLLLAHAVVDFQRGRLASMVERHRAAVALLDAAHPSLPPTEAAELRAVADWMTAVSCLYRGDGAGAVEAARRALPQFPDTQSFVGGNLRLNICQGLLQLGRRDEALRALGEGGDGAAAGARAPREMYALALVHLSGGDLPAARRWAAALLEATERRDLPILHGWGHCLLGRIAYELNALHEARERFAAAAEGHRSNFVVTSESLLGLALTEQALGRSAVSERLLADLDELLAETGNDEGRPKVNACQARLALQRGDRGEAARWLAATPPDRTDILWFMECPSLTVARVLLARGRPADVAAAAAVLATFRAQAEREHATIWVIAALAVQALAEQAAGDEPAALDRLGAALALAEPGGFVRTFLDLGAPMAALLRALAGRRPPASYPARLLAAFGDAPASPEAAPEAPPTVTSPSSAPRAGRPAGDPARALASLLTEREVEVLELMGRHLTNKEIAAALSISPMTVKRHVSNVFDKLGVGSRRQAVAQAVALGLLPPAAR